MKSMQSSKQRADSYIYVSSVYGVIFIMDKYKYINSRISEGRIVSLWGQAGKAACMKIPKGFYTRDQFEKIIR